MEAGGKDCEEETLQTAFKKLRVDAESLPAAVNVPEGLASRVVPRACPEPSGAKPKLSCSKDNWHGCIRKTSSSRGASRSQRRRRSKSPILHPPKFTYCSGGGAAPALTPPSGCPKHQRLTVPESTELDGNTNSALAVTACKELPSSGHIPSPVFGASAGYESSIVVSPPQEIPTITTTTITTTTSTQDSGSTGMVGGPPADVSGPEKGPRDESRPVATEASDFQALSKLHSGSGSAGPSGLHPPCCTCARRENPDHEPGSQGDAENGGAAEGASSASGSECLCQSGQRPCPLHTPGCWQGVEVYSFTGLRDVISECERSLPPASADPRTLLTTNNAAATVATTSPTSSGSPRSCSEQARAYVDDITIEDLSGYMEYYLYIPKKMSHMAEMMYT